MKSALPSIRQQRGNPASRAEPAQAIVELESGGTCVSAETAQRMACDASVVVMHHGADGSVLDVGRKRRTAPTPIRRALAARDRHCQFPGCTARRCDAHHLQPWALGGRTSLEGLILLCRRHHTAVHEGGLTIQRARDGTMTVVWPDGRRLDATPPIAFWADPAPSPLGPTASRLAAAGVSIGPRTTQAWMDGGPVHLAWAVGVLYEPPPKKPCPFSGISSASGSEGLVSDREEPPVAQSGHRMRRFWQCLLSTR